MRSYKMATYILFTAYPWTLQKRRFKGQLSPYSPSVLIRLCCQLWVVVLLVSIIAVPIILLLQKFGLNRPVPLPHIVIGVVLAILIVVGAVVLIRHITNRSSSPSGLIRNTMQDALLKLHEGADLKHIIVRCYYEMGQVLMKERGITRNKDMTPREFESVLCNSGLPNEPLFQLTRLFEEIRYGNKVSDELKKRDAIRCLTAIIKACETEP